MKHSKWLVSTSILIVGSVTRARSYRTSSRLLINLDQVSFHNNKGCLSLPKQMNFRKNSKRPLTPPLIFGKSCCGFFKKLYSLKNHTCGIFLKSPGYESIKNNDPCCQIQSINFKFWGWLGPRLLVHWGKVRGSHRSGTGSHMETHRTEHVYISPVCCSRYQQQGIVLWDVGAPA